MLKKSIWVNPANGHEILQEDGSKITLNFDKNNAECIVLINKIRASINATNDTIKAAASVDPLPLAEKVWQDLWAVSGAMPENCLYTFVEIFIFKYLSDLGVLKGMYSFYDLLSKYSGNNENEVLEFYASTIRVKIKELFPGNPKDKTTIINGTIFVSKDDKAVSGYTTVFHKILKRFNDFGTLENIDYDFKSIMIPVPVDDQGHISLAAQKEIAVKYLGIEQCKNEVISKLDNLIQQKIEL